MRRSIFDLCALLVITVKRRGISAVVLLLKLFRVVNRVSVRRSDQAGAPSLSAR